MIPNDDAIAQALASTERYLTPMEVATLFRVDPKTVTRWAKSQDGKPPRLASVRTPGGHHRFPLSEIERALREGLSAR